MRHAALLLAGLACWSALSASGQEPASSARIQRLISRLGSGDFAQREAATQELTAIGEPALAALRAAASDGDIEVCRRAAEIVRGIERQQESARLIAGQRIRLAFDDTPILDAVAELNRLTGFSWRLNPADIPQLADSKVTLQTPELTIWEAFDRFCTAAGLCVGDPVNGAKASLLSLGKAPAAPTCFAGALRVRATTPPSAGWGVTPGVYEVPIGLEVNVEPKLQWHGVVDVAIRRALDDKGQELEQSTSLADGLGTNPYEEDIRWIRRRGVWQRQEILDQAEAARSKQLSIRLKLGKEVSHTVKELQGVLVGQMDTPPEPLVEAENVLRLGGETLRGKDGSQLKIGEVKRDESGVVQVAVDLLFAPAEDLLQLSLPANNRRLLNQALVWQLRAEMRNAASPQIELRDSAGKLFDVARYNEASQLNGYRMQYSATLHFLPREGVGAPARLLLIGRRTVTVEVPFTLKNVPLP